MSGRFITGLHATKIQETDGLGRARWKLTAPLVYHSDLIGEVEVPTGFLTDFASVPRLPLAYMLTGDTAHASAVVHDHLVGRYEWVAAADVFREAMRAEGVPAWRAWGMYWAVRLFGRPRSE
jgi:hypothetical protein